MLLIAACQSGPSQESRVDHLPFYADASFTPHWISPGSSELNSFHRISSFELLNQDNQLLSSENLEGKIYVADFFFSTCSGICPRMTYNMSLLQEEFLDDEDVVLLSFSVTPGVDSVATLHSYAKRNGVQSGKWHLLTGSRKEIYDLGRKSYYVEEDLGIGRSEDEFLHTENFVLIDGNSHIRGIYNGLNMTSLQNLMTDIRTLKSESSG